MKRPINCQNGLFSSHSKTTFTPITLYRIDLEPQIWLENDCEFIYNAYEPPKTSWMGLGHFLLEIGKCPPNSHLNPAIDVLALFSSNTVITGYQ